MNRKSIFENIYLNREWGSNRTLSGEGTLPEAAEEYVRYLSEFLKSNKDINSILDVGHGDWKMWPRGYFDKYNYTGVDTAHQIVEECKREFSGDNIKFIEGDFLEIELPKSDVLLIKDVLIHLSDEDILRSLKKIRDFKYSLITTDIKSNGWRVLAGNIKREFKKGIDLNNFLSVIYKSMKRDYLTNDIITGSYHWVNLADQKWNLNSLNLSIIKTFDYVNRGFTPGRSTHKRIFLITSSHSPYGT